MKPHTSYTVCGTPRSGSGLLCEVLWKTGLAGRPDEYFLRKYVEKYSEIWRASTSYEYLNKIIEEGTTGNGVFGIKIMWDQVGYFREKVLRIPQYMHLQTPDLMGCIFPNLHYIRITRRDKVRQAVSFYKAKKTGIYNWHEGEPTQYLETLEFNFKAIDRLIHNLCDWDSSWQNYFEALKISPFNVVYEDDLEHGYEGVIKRILTYLGVNIPDGLTIQAKRRKQSDEHSERFVRLYLDALQGNKKNQRE